MAPLPDTKVVRELRYRGEDLYLPCTPDELARADSAAMSGSGPGPERRAKAHQQDRNTALQRHDTVPATSPAGCPYPLGGVTSMRIRHRDRLGGLIQECTQVA